MYLGAELRRQLVFHGALLDEAHGRSSGSVAYLKDARLERSRECQRREGKNGLLSQAYACTSPRAGELLFAMVKIAHVKPERDFRLRY